tara:strand:- start:249 stop:659 length:411 start_codon:yes stop_codon:yes gene_type:complete
MSNLYKISKIKFIKNIKGNIYKLIQNKNNKNKFDELYISKLNPHKTKAWKYHENKVQRIYIPVGKVKIGIYQPKTKKIKTINLGENDNKMLIIYNKVFYGFKSITKNNSLIINLTYISNINKEKPENQPSIEDLIK